MMKTFKGTKLIIEKLHLASCNLKQVIALLLVVLMSFIFIPVPKAYAAAGEGTATIAVDGGAQGASVTVIQSTSHTFTVVLTVGISGMTLGASSPTFTIPTGFTAPTLHSVATAGDVNADGLWSVIAAGGGCTVDSAPGSATTTATGQVITVDVTADCAAGHTITLTYQGTSAIAMGATALEVRTADGAPPASLIAASPTITVTAASTPAPSTSSNSSSSSSGGSSTVSTPLDSGIIAPTIIDSRRVDADSIFISWGPYSGTDKFNIQYGLTNGNWLYSTNVTGFSSTINDLPTNQPIWIRIAARNDQSIGKYGEAKLVGGPSLPNAGFAPRDNNTPSVPVAVGVAILGFLVLTQKKYRFLPRH